MLDFDFLEKDPYFVYDFWRKLFNWQNLIV